MPGKNLNYENLSNQYPITLEWKTVSDRSNDKILFRDISLLANPNKISQLLEYADDTLNLVEMNGLSQMKAKPR